MTRTEPNGPVVLSIDAGTTGIRAFAVDQSGAPVCASYREFTQHFPSPGLVEHDAEEIWRTTVVVLDELCRTIDRPVAALGITNQRETVVAWSRRTGAPLAPAIVWQDRRTASRCDELTADGRLPLIRNTTGLVLDPYFSATKIEWLLSNGVPNDSDLMLGTIDTWLIWKLSGGAAHVTDTSNASRTMLFDINSLEWSSELLDLFSVPRTSLPRVVPSVGQVALTVAGCGVPEGVPISGIVGDQQGALFGQACLAPGMVKNTYGTGSFVLMNTGESLAPSTEGLLRTVAWTVPTTMLNSNTDQRATTGPSPIGDGPHTTHYALEGAIFVTGAAVQWLRDGLSIIDSAGEVGPLAQSVEDSGGVILVPAFTGLGSPYWDPSARGSIFGITRGTTRAHLARAVVEAMAYQTRDVVDAMRNASGASLRQLRVDGGAAVMDRLLQIQADQLNCEVLRSSVAETTALGAAYMAGLGAGVWTTAAEIESNWANDATFGPNTDRSAADAGYALWKRGVTRSLNWAED